MLVILRAPYPYELEWQEGGMLAHVERVIAGEPLYIEPSLEFAAFPYPPLYAWVASLATRVIGPGFLALRLVSIVATAATLVLLHVSGRRRGGSALAGLAAAGSYAACYRFAGAWTDLARVDALELLLLLSAFEVLDARRGTRFAALGGAMLALACLAKQSALLAAAGLLVGLARRDGREALVATATFALLAGAVVLVLERASDGWFRWAVVRVLAGHGWSSAQAIGYWRELALTLWPVAIVVALAAWRARPRSGDTRPLASWLAVALLADAWLERSHTGGYDNAFLPAALGCALLVGPALGRLRERGGALAIAASLLYLLHLALLAYDPRVQVPTAADRATGERIVAFLRAAPGEVFVPYHGYLARAAGKGPCVHAMALNDLLRSGDQSVATRFVAQLEEALAARRWSTIVIDDPIWEMTLPGLLPNYRFSETLFFPHDGNAFVPVTGAPWRPLLVYEPRLR